MVSVEQFSPAAPLHSGGGSTQLQGILLSQIIHWHRIQYCKHPGLATVPAAGSGHQEWWHWALCWVPHGAAASAGDRMLSAWGACTGHSLSVQGWVWRCSAHCSIRLSIINHFKYLKSSAVMTAQVINCITFNRPFKQCQVSDICCSVEVPSGKNIFNTVIPQNTGHRLKMAVQRIKCFSRLSSSPAYCSAKKMTIHPLTGGWFNCNLLLKAHNLTKMHSALLGEAHVLLHLISGFYPITVAHFSIIVFDPKSRRVLTLSSCTVLLQSNEEDWLTAAEYVDLEFS